MNKNKVLKLSQKVAKLPINENSETNSNHFYQDDNGQNTKHNAQKLCTLVVRKSPKQSIDLCLQGQSDGENNEPTIGKFDGKNCEKNNNVNNKPFSKKKIDGANKSCEFINTTRSDNKIFKNNKDVSGDENDENIESVKKCGDDENHKFIRPKIIAFWRPSDPYGYLGQWYISDFGFTSNDQNQLPDKIKNLGLFNSREDVVTKMMIKNKYNCTEQFMMMGKAALFNDNDIFDKLYQIKSPCTQKSYGRKVSGFDERTWDTFSKDIVILGNYLKFSQNSLLLDKLKSTNGSMLVEGSPLDRIWGVGMKYDDPCINNKDKWRGKNYLGHCLEYVRECFT